LVIKAPPHESEHGSEAGRFEDLEISPWDAELIINASTDLTDLCAEVRHLQASLRPHPDGIDSPMESRSGRTQKDQQGTIVDDPQLRDVEISLVGDLWTRIRNVTLSLAIIILVIPGLLGGCYALLPFVLIGLAGIAVEAYSIRNKCTHYRALKKLNYNV